MSRYVVTLRIPTRFTYTLDADDAEAAEAAAIELATRDELDGGTLDWEVDELEEVDDAE